MLYALLFLPALVAIVLILRPRPVRVLAESVSSPLAELDALLADLERATVSIDGADELDESAVVALERLADRLEETAASLERVG